jgi:hypothetical protein
MRSLLLVLISLALLSAPVLAGKNAGGALVVHTAYVSYYFPVDYCTSDFDDPGTCENANTESTVDGNLDASIVWLLAAFPPDADPGVSVIYFGVEHNLPYGWFAGWGPCGPEGTLEIPDAGWPNDWETAGNSVALGSPIVGDQFFLFYWLAPYGLAGNYLGTGINPTGGYAGFVSDDNPGILDEIIRFGQVRWFEPGFNQCPQLEHACCIDGECFLITEEECTAAGGIWYPDEDTCEGFDCPPVAVEETTWGSVKALYSR